MKNGNNAAGLGVLFFKLAPKLSKIFFGILKSTKVLFFGASAATYSVLFGWKAALMILAFLFMHEGGHFWAMRQRGMKTKGLYFIPFLGAAAVAEEEFPSRETESYVALMGPIFGLILAVLAYFAFLITQDLELAAAAGWMALITLLNFLPIMPLDGGRVLKSIAFSMNSGVGFLGVLLGMGAGAYFAFQNGFFLFVFLIPIGLIDIFFDWDKNRKRVSNIITFLAFRAILADLKRSAKTQAVSMLPEIDQKMQYIQRQLEQEGNSLRPGMDKTAVAKSIGLTAVLVLISFILMWQATEATMDSSFMEILR